MKEKLNGKKKPKPKPRLLSEIKKDKLKELLERLPGFEFRESAVVPGVYIMYNPEINKAYVGESNNVSFEMSQYAGKHRSRMSLDFINDIDAYSPNSFERIVVFNDSLDFEDREVRLNMEEFILSQIGDISYNVVNNPFKQPLAKKQPERLERAYIEGSLNRYGFTDVFGIKMSKGQPCVYAMIHRASGNVYIGESSDFLGTNRMGHHATSIRRAVSEIKDGSSQKRKSSVYYLIGQDIIDTGSEAFDIACLQVASHNSKERLQLESVWKTFFYNKFGDKLYNPDLQLNVTATTLATVKVTKGKPNIQFEITFPLPLNLLDDLTLQEKRSARLFDTQMTKIEQLASSRNHEIILGSYANRQSVFTLYCKTHKKTQEVSFAAYTRKDVFFGMECCSSAARTPKKAK